MQTDKIWIDNLKCEGCANSINKTVSAIIGVELVNVDVENSSVEYHHNGEVQRIDIIQKLSKMGYPEQGTSTLGQKAKSYISCAIGRMS